MNSNKKTVRIVGALFLLIFMIGVFVYQFLQGSILFADDFLIGTSSNANQIIISTLLSFFSGTLSILVAALLLPIFRRYSYSLAYLYLGFCIVYFVAIAMENLSVLSMLELSHEYVKNGAGNDTFFQSMGAVFYKEHRWAHYICLLFSCFPAFVLYYTLFYSKLIHRAISIIGLIAVVLMFVQMLFTIFGKSISMDMMLPIALIQLFLPFWLMIKGFRPEDEVGNMEK